ncbi:MAG: OFA family MFS transporter [Deltaproteobacteria bacterium]|nr:OFA family MFS transporter [Deltaproteobacteria bacterium]
MTEKNLPNRWLIAAAGVVMQLCLGTVYAWSVFIRPLNAMWQWTPAQITLAFTLVIVVLSLAAAVGGYILDSKGPRIVATMGGLFFGVGMLITGYGVSIGSLTVVYLGYGLICGIGLGFGYITPIATLVKWFPDKRGLITGLAVFGFGLGSGIMALLASTFGMIVKLGPANTLYIFGAVFLVAVTAAGQLMVSPPAGYAPAGWTPPAGAPAAASGMTLGEAVSSKYFYLLWIMLFVNITAGMAVISQAAPLAQHFMSSSVANTAALAGTLMLLFAFFNAVGRLAWATVSDKIGRRQVFITLFVSQAIVFFILFLTPIGDVAGGAPGAISIVIFTIMACYIYACLGGGFATMPAYAADTFGTKYVGRIYGWMLTAWGAAGIVGPQLYSRVPYKQALLITAIMFAVALIVPFLAAPKKAA